MIRPQSLGLALSRLAFWALASASMWLSIGQAASAEDPPKKPLTAFERDVLDRAEIIAIVEVVEVRRASPGTEVAVFEITKRFLGNEESRVVVLASRGTFFAGTQSLVFLEPYGKAGRYRCFGRVSPGDVDFQAKSRALETHLSLRAIEDPEKRAERVLEAILQNLGSEERWTADHFARQLYYFAENFPGKFEARHLESLRKVYRRMGAGSAKTTVGRVLDFLEKRDSGR